MARLPMLPLKLPPGVARNGTRYQVKGRWYDASQIRWVDDIMQPIGGWAAITTTPLADPARGMLAWRTNSGGRFFAVGTPSKLWVGKGDATLYDITPAGYVGGFPNGVEQLGYGGSTYGTGTYGTPRAGGVYLPPSTWQLDTWGDNLVACAKGDGKIYQWALATGTPAAVVTNAPTNNIGMLVTEQRHLMALGAGGNGRLLKWSGVENNTLWTPDPTNEAGSIELVTSGTIMRGVRVRGQILVLTNVDAHVATYLAQPLIWGRDKIGDQCGLIGPNAVVVAGNTAFWMSDKRFWQYDGASVQELPCEVADYVFNNMNISQAEKFFAGSNGAFEEVQWNYCGPGVSEPDRYVAYNYKRGFWMLGSLPRAAWVDKSVFPTPMAVGTDGLVYNHETGTLGNGSSRVGAVYAETSALEAANGDNFLELSQMITDEKTLGDIQFKFRGRDTPNDTEYSYGPFLARADGYVDSRLSGRQLVMRVEPVTDNAWQLGIVRWDAKSGSRR